MRLGTFLSLFDTFYDMMFVGKSLHDMKVVYYSKEAAYFRNRGAPDLAVESYRKALRLDPDNFYVHTRLAHLFAGRREFQKRP
jgi:tetratricopeptide (TPR) repeat protein